MASQITSSVRGSKISRSIVVGTGGLGTVAAYSPGNTPIPAASLRIQDLRSLIVPRI